MIWQILTALTLLIGLTLLTLRHAFIIAKVQGISMLPTYQDGDRLLVLRYRFSRRLKKGSVIVLDKRLLPAADDHLEARDLETSIDNAPRLEFGTLPSRGEIRAELASRPEFCDMNAEKMEEIVKGFHAFYTSNQDINFDLSFDEGNSLYIKRVVGMPGETVSLHKNKVVELTTPKIRNNNAGEFQTWQIPTDHYFVLGDNRDFSADSRMFGPIPREALMGIAIYQFSGHTI